MPEQIKSIYELIDSKSFRNRPAMYLGSQSISKLKIFMDGYDFCQFTNNIKEEEISPPFWLFNAYVEKQTNQLYSSHSWTGLILNKNNGDEKQALDQFFNLFDSFRKNITNKTYLIKLDEKCKDYFNSQKFEYFTNDNGQMVSHIEKPMDEMLFVDFGEKIGIASMSENIVYDNFEEMIKGINSKYGNNIEVNEIKNG